MSTRMRRFAGSDSCMLYCTASCSPPRAASAAFRSAHRALRGQSAQARGRLLCPLPPRPRAWGRGERARRLCSRTHARCMRLQGFQIAPAFAFLERVGIALFKRRVALHADVIAEIILGGGAVHNQAKTTRLQASPPQNRWVARHPLKSKIEIPLQCRRGSLGSPDSASRGHATMQIFVKTVWLLAGISCADRASPRALFAVAAPSRVPHPSLHPVCCASIEVRRKPLTPARWCAPAQTVDR